MANPILLNKLSLSFRSAACMLLLMMASCGGGGGGSSTGIVSSSSLASVKLNFSVPGQSTAMDTTNHKLIVHALSAGSFDILIPRAWAIATPGGIASAAVRINGTGVTSVNDIFNITPGILVSRTYNLPIGTTPTLLIAAYNGPLGTGTKVYQSPASSLNLTNATAGSAVPFNVQMNPLINVPPAPTAPAITSTSGTAASSQIAPADPNTGDTHTYAITAQPASGTATVSATGLVSYTSNAGFVGNDSLSVTVTDQGGLTGIVKIAATLSAPALAANNQPVFTGTPGIVQNTATTGTQLSLTGLGTSDADGNTVTLSYQWRTNNVAIAGATTAAYTVLAADTGKSITCVITADDGSGATNATVTATTNNVVVNVSPAFTGTPGIIQTSAVVADTLTLTGTGTSDADGNTVTLSYQWRANNAAISGATSSTYVVKAGDRGKTVTCVLTANDGSGA
ncbi:MAG: Ig-like domain-containing protein, partial [Mariprofundaceae bacterium]|nr:Ig-like domain-containing protein [Mariprofundaceae bacterium]